jgi:flagella basal body P-ring formation protein FlgA
MVRAPIIALLVLAAACTALAGEPRCVAVDSAIAAVRARVEAAGEECEIAVATVPQAPAGMDSWSSIRVETIPGDRLHGQVTVWVSGTAADGSRRRAPIGLRVRTFDTVLVAVRPLERHTVPGMSDVERRRVETTTLPAGAVRAAEELTGWRVNRVIAAGAVVHRTMLEALPAIRSGDRVTVVARSGGVRLSVPGTARQDGCVGSTILVQREGMHARIRGHVVDAGTVEVRVH